MPRCTPRFPTDVLPSTWILLVAAVPCLLIASARIGACWYPPTADLWTLTSEADHVLFVEVEEIRRSRLDLSRLQLPRQVAVEIVTLVSEDLGWIVDEKLPEAPSSPIFVSTVRILDDLSASPDVAVGSRHTVVLDGSRGFLAPGQPVLLFLRGDPPRHRLLPYGNAALYFADDSDLQDLESVVGSALALQESGLDQAPAEWQTLALSLPGSRGHAWMSERDARFDRAAVAEALVLFPADPSTDLRLLDRLGDVQSPELDLLAIAWTDALLAHHEDHGLHYTAMRIAAQRWSVRRRIETDRIQGLAGDFQTDSETIRQRWNILRDELRLPYVDTSTILERLEVNRQRSREILGALRTFR